MVYKLRSFIFFSRMTYDCLAVSSLVISVLSVECITYVLVLDKGCPAGCS
uniref:Uncharacterized protein n=1 Tax=Arundo donax TaxID=35708 RepID=A0A0A9H0B5_ARUDO